MLEAGEIDAFIGPRTPSCFEQGKPNIGWLFPDPMAAAEDYFRKTGIFPIMHMIGVRRALVAQHPWLPAAVLKAFTRAKSAGLALLEDTSASKVTLPFIEERVKAARDLMGEDFWPYGIPANRKQLEYFLAQHHRQGLSSRLVKLDELFHPTTFESYKL
jgi:4,5-dihydroxyphthalate decarboxylase